MLLTPAAIEDLKRRNPCHEIAGRLVALRRKGDGFVGPCPLHSPDRQARDSTSFECDAESWVCATCSDGGDVIKLVALVNGLDPDREFRRAISLLPDGGTREISADEQAELERQHDDRRAKAAQDQNEFREKARRRAWDLWAFAKPIAGSPGEAYLRRRLGDLDPPRLRLKFDPAARYYVEDRPTWRLVHTGPAIVAQIQRDGQFLGAHRTFIDLEDPKGKARIVDPKTGLKLNSKTMHGGKRGGHIALAGPRFPRVLYLGEGIEKVAAVLAAMRQAGRELEGCAFWTAGDLGNLGGKAAETIAHPTLKSEKGRAVRVPGFEPDLESPAIQIPDSVERLVLLGDTTSDRFTTECVLERARRRYAREGLEIVAAWGPASGDFDDLLREGADRDQAVAQILAAIDQARAPEAPELAPAQPAQESKAAARKRRADQSPAPSGEDPAACGETLTAETAAPGGASFNSASSSSPPPDDEIDLNETLKACAELDKSDTDNGKRLMAHFGRDLVVRAEREVAAGTWLHWTKTHWDIDGGAAAVALLAQKVGDLIVREADFIEQTPRERELIAAGKAAAEQIKALELVSAEERSEDDKNKIALLRAAELAGSKAYGQWQGRKQRRRDQGVTAKNAGKISALLDCAGPHLRRSPDLFNADGYLVATRKHTLRFKRELSAETTDHREAWDASLEVIEGHRRDDYITACVPVTFDRGAAMPAFKAFIERFLPDPDVRRTVQQFCGLSLLNVSTQFFMIHYGNGANGKSVFLETLFRLFGPSFAVGLPQESIAGSGQRGSGQAQPDIALLHAKRFLRVTELKEGVPLQEDVIKRLTGGEAITARTMYKGYFDFVPLAKPHFSCNGFPKIDGGSAAMFRRALIVEWPVTLARDEQRDFDIVVGELLADAPGILNWLIEGALEYMRHGLFVAPGVTQATQAYRDEMDTVGVFRRACVHEKDGGTIRAREMYRAYLAWCEANAKNPVKETRFGREMKKLVKRDDSGAVHAYVGVELRDVPASEFAEQQARVDRADRSTNQPHADEEVAF